MDYMGLREVGIKRFKDWGWGVTACSFVIPPTLQIMRERMSVQAFLSVIKEDVIAADLIIP